MKENLRTTSYSNGTTITRRVWNRHNSNSKYYFVYNDVDMNKNIYGLPTQAAVMNSAEQVIIIRAAFKEFANRLARA